MVQTVMHNLHKIGGMVGGRAAQLHSAALDINERCVRRARLMFDALFTKPTMQARRAAIADAIKPFIAPPLTETRRAMVLEPHVIDIGQALKISKYALISEIGHARERQAFARISPRNNDRLQT